MFSASLAHAFGASPGGAGGGFEMFAQFVPLILMIAVFWFLLIRPQRKRQQEHKVMLENLRRNDAILTTGGLIGRILDIDGDILTVDLGDTKVRIGRGFVSALYDEKTLPPLLKEKKRKSEFREDKSPKDSARREAPEDRKVARRVVVDSNGSEEEREDAEKYEVDNEASEERKEDREEEHREDRREDRKEG